MKNNIRIAMLCTDGQSSRIMYHGLSPHVDVVAVIIENSVSARYLIKRRIKNLGLDKVIGQLFFLALNKFIAGYSRKRIKQLLSDFDLDDSPLPENISIRVDSVNSNRVIELLRDINPDAVVVNGTRIISREILAATGAPFINTHMGITPRYRGVHGGYWALANNDRENCGVTVHLVDLGIDTGGVLYQDRIDIDRRDNFNTYPIHQIAKAVPLMQAALEDVRNHNVEIKPGVSPSRLWSHPTLFEYIKHRISGAAK